MAGPPDPQTLLSLIAGWEFPDFQANCALGDKFLQFGMVLGMGIRFSKTTAYKLGQPPGGRYAQNPIWPPNLLN